MSLYEISNDLFTVINGGMVFDPESGEIYFDSENLDELKDTFNDKVEACALFIKNLDAEVEALKTEEKSLSERRRVKENKAQRLREYVLKCLEQNDIKTVETAKARVSTRKSKYVEIFDENKISRDFLKIKTTEHIDKKAIKEAIESGVEVDGATMMERYTLQLK